MIVSGLYSRLNKSQSAVKSTFEIVLFCKRFCALSVNMDSNSGSLTAVIRTLEGGEGLPLKLQPISMNFCG